MTMPQNLLEELTHAEVPPPPLNMQRGVHERLNHWLTTGQLIELVVHAFAYAAYHFAPAVAGAVLCSLTGKFPVPRDARDAHGNEPSE
jgi:hypothetical protein